MNYLARYASFLTRIGYQAAYPVKLDTHLRHETARLYVHPALRKAAASEQPVERKTA